MFLVRRRLQFPRLFNHFGAQTIRRQTLQSGKSKNNGFDSDPFTAHPEGVHSSGDVTCTARRRRPSCGGHLSPVRRFPPPAPRDPSLFGRQRSTWPPNKSPGSLRGKRSDTGRRSKGAGPGVGVGTGRWRWTGGRGQRSDFDPAHSLASGCGLTARSRCEGGGP